MRPGVRRIFVGRKTPCALIVMGVSGSGKSTSPKPRATARLALRGRRQVSPRKQCRQDERRPSVDRRGPLALAQGDRRRDRPRLGRRRTAVVACSALKRTYRDILLNGRDDVRFVFLDGTEELIADRLARARGTSCRRGCWRASSRRWSRRARRTSDHGLDRCDGRAIVDDIVRQLKLAL